MRAHEREYLLKSRGLVSAECLICGNANPPGEFSFESFWVRGKEDWDDYTGGPVHRACVPTPPVAARRLRWDAIIVGFVTVLTAGSVYLLLLAMVA